MFLLIYSNTEVPGSFQYIVHPKVETVMNLNHKLVLGFLILVLIIWDLFKQFLQEYFQLEVGGNHICDLLSKSVVLMRGPFTCRYYGSNNQWWFFFQYVFYVSVSII